MTDFNHVKNSNTTPRTLSVLNKNKNKIPECMQICILNKRNIYEYDLQNVKSIFEFCVC